MPASSLDDQLKTPRILWLALFVSPMLFLGAGLLNAPPQQNAQHVPVPLLALAAVAIAAMSFVMPGVTMKKRLARTTFPVIEEGAEANDFRSGPEKMRVLAEPEAALRMVLPAYAQAMILGLATAEAVALLGFTAAYFERVTWEAAPFFVVSWALMAMHFPTREKVIAALERTSGAKYRATGASEVITSDR